MSVDSAALEANGASVLPSISADGLVVAFESFAWNLVAQDTNAKGDIFVHERCGVIASWTNYGSGYPGTYGVPSFTSGADPVLGTTLALDLANSYGWFTPCMILVGFQRAQIHSGWGGDLLVDPALTFLFALPPSGETLQWTIPGDDNLGGVVLDLQALESDPGAARAVSFTAGLELIPGE